ncbi:hypothetical protein Rsub_11126 [Raphidocelis subcapitata]|uniref:Uncharacterized protein n=1 Tax=Raphidocelis subcapitata TaxID=307507 RepID=A0A2V0PLV0_9CHLO|nr:hypothetical protein Rsub_11126 [Raphidocelis subcapitata]|eukprot:GBF98015.1 hypothetical protein Rsub_11126 [Raphidocelis subcapitata]
MAGHAPRWRGLGRSYALALAAALLALLAAQQARRAVLFGGPVEAQCGSADGPGYVEPIGPQEYIQYYPYQTSVDGGVSWREWDSDTVDNMLCIQNTTNANSAPTCGVNGG